MNETPAGAVRIATVREPLPASQAKERTTPEFWAYIEALKPADFDRHICYLYRVEDGRNVPLEKFSAHLTMPDGRQIPSGDREEIELAIAQKYGGRTFRLILKRGSERVTETRLYVDAPPKMVAPQSFETGSVGQPMGEASATADVAHHAINTMANQDRTLMDVAVNAVRSSAEIVQRLGAAPNAPPASESDQMFKTLMVRVMERMMNPVDPLDLLTKVMALQSQLNPGSNSNPVLAKVLDQAVEKLLNPSPSGPVASAGAELVRVLPNVAAYAVQGLSEWRMGVEAQRDTVAMTQGRAPIPARPVQPSPSVLTAPQPNPQPEGTVAGPGIEFVEGKIVEIMKEPISAEEAADKTLEFLEVMDARLVPQLFGLGEAGLLNLFQTRPTLKPALQNLSRLQEFIRAFLKFAGENAAGAKPN